MNPILDTWRSPPCIDRSPLLNPEEKYPALRIVLIIWKALVLLLFIATFVATYWVWQSPDLSRNHVALGLLTLLGGAIVCLFQWANIELIEVLLDIEENTRRTADRGST